MMFDGLHFCLLNIEDPEWKCKQCNQELITYVKISESATFNWALISSLVFEIMYNWYLFNSYTTGTCGLPDIYTRSPRAEGVYIRRTTSAHGIIIM